jgi:hypothetical protein
MSIPGSSSIRPWKMSRSSCICTSSPQSVDGPRAGDTGGGSSDSPRYVRIFRIGPGSRTGSPQQPEVATSAKARDGFALGKQSERNQPDVAAAPRALERKLLPRPGHEFRPGNSGGVVRAGRRSLLDQQPARRLRRSLESRRCTWWLSAEPKRCRKEMPPSRGQQDAGASLVTPAAVHSDRSISSRKIFVRAATARGRSASMHRSRFGTEITHCRTGTGGMT